MRIGIDTFGCIHGRSGLGSYLLSILQNLPQLENTDYEIFGPEMDRFTFQFEHTKYNSINIPDSLATERIWHTLKANSYAKKHDFSAVLYAAATRMIPQNFKVPGVAIVNDILSNRIKNGDNWIEKQIKRGFSKVDCIITASEFVRQDLIDLGVKCENIQVVHSGINHSLFYPSESIIENTDVLDIKPFAIKRPYIIYAGKMENADKKHIELINAFTMFKQKTQLPHRLVLAGAEGAYSENIHKAAFSSPVASDIFLTGYFPHESFAQLYRYADAVVIPCVDDGSGLTVLEALATGVPVACSLQGAQTELAKDSALYFDSNNVEQMADCIQRIIEDNDLRQNLTHRALEVTKEYSWEKAASQTVEIIRNLVGE